MNKFFIKLAIFFVFNIVTHQVFGQEHLSETAKGVVKIIADETSGFSVGSGVISSIENNTIYILTTYHLVSRSESVQVIFYGQVEAYTGIVSAKYSKEADIALVIVQVPAVVSKNIKFLSIGDTSQVVRGDEVSIIGHPMGHDWFTSSGKISKVLEAKFYIETGMTAPGISGSPLLNHKSQIIGIITSYSPPFVVATNIDRANNIVEIRRLQPQLSWINKFSSTQEQQVEIQIQYSAIAPLNYFVFIHNGLPIEVNVPKDSKTRKVITIPLVLSNFRNSINVWAGDTNNMLPSKVLTETFEFTLGAKGAENIKPGNVNNQLGKYGKKYAVIIGVSNYKNLPETSKDPNTLIDLKHADKDAEKFEEFLNQEHISGGDWEIYTFINQSADSNEIDKCLTKILTQANRRDLIYIFFSGHGRSHPQREKDIYLLTYDFEEDVYRSGISYSILLNLIAESPAEHIVAFIDACRSGAIGFGKGNQKQANFNQDVFHERLAQIPENKVIFTSGSGTQKSWEDDQLQLSVFTHFLLEGLRGKAPEHKNDQFVDLAEINRYVKDKVEYYTRNHPNMSIQIPDMRERSGLLFEDFPLAIRTQ